MSQDLRENLRQAYNNKAVERDDRTIQDWKLQEQQIFLALLQKEHKTRLLELGAGTGLDGQFFQAQGFTVTCTDLSPEMVRFCRQKGLDAHVMDFAHLDFPPASFDAVYALNSLLHLPKKELPKVLTNIDQLLHKNGLFYLGVYGGPDREGIYEEDTYEPKRFFAFYPDETLKQIVSNVFDLHQFNSIPLEADSTLHFQSFILRKC
ncbi:MAG: class I SAM-dependent methyltransferase [Chloroflexota bacterium]